MFEWWSKIKKLLKYKSNWEIIKLVLYWIFGLGILIWIFWSLVKK